MAEFIVVHNIPSPYRLHLFRVLAERLGSRGHQLHVHFMAAGHSDRPHWHADEKDFGFASTTWRDVGPEIRGKRWHLNPGLIAAVLRAGASHVMIGGPWDSLTGFLVSLAPVSAKKIAWIEGNTKTPGIVSGVQGRTKRRLLSRCDFLAVPGEEGRSYAQLICGERAAPRTVILPNLVDEARFRGRRSEPVEAVRARYGLRSDARLALWNARLIPEKGVIEFLSTIEAADLNGWQILLLGQGPLEPRIRELISARYPPEAVRLLPYVPYETMPAIYAAADLMLLPSLHDPNPLSIVEALHASLPLLVSDRIGNFPEALEESANGWSFSPFNPSSVRRAARAAFSADLDSLRRMGERSGIIAGRHWSSRGAVDGFLSALGIQ